jgi:hypothetical protein
MYRHIIFLVIPVILRILPSSRPPANLPMASLPATLGFLEQSLARIHLLKFTRASIMRDLHLRGTAGEWWDRERKEGEWGREDADVQRMAEKLGFGYTDRTEHANGSADAPAAAKGVKLKTNAKLAVDALKNAFKPSEGINT